jgi:hypothetical protein
MTDSPPGLGTIGLADHPTLSISAKLFFAVFAGLGRKLSLCTTAHPFHSTSTNIIGTFISETTM